MTRGLAIALTAVAAAPAGTIALSAAGHAATRRATLRTRPCPRDITEGPARYVRVTGSGFTPASGVAIGYRGAGKNGHPDLLRVDARGRLAGRVSGPARRALRRYVTPVVLHATDTGRPARGATARFSIVRLAVRLPRVTRPHAVVTFRLYGFPDHAVVWAHYFFGGRPVATTRMGATRGACGLVRRRARYLPAKIRYGRWHLYLSVRQRFSRADARHRRYVLMGSFRVLDRRYFTRPRAARAGDAVVWSSGRT